MLSEKPIVAQKAQQVGDIVRIGYTRLGGETREKFARRIQLDPELVHAAVDGKVRYQENHGSYTSVCSRKDLLKMVDGLKALLKPEERGVLVRLIGEIAPTSN